MDCMHVAELAHCVGPGLVQAFPAGSRQVPWKQTSPPQQSSFAVHDPVTVEQQAVTGAAAAFWAQWPEQHCPSPLQVASRSALQQCPLAQALVPSWQHSLLREQEDDERTSAARQAPQVCAGPTVPRQTLAGAPQQTEVAGVPELHVPPEPVQQVPVGDPVWSGHVCWQSVFTASLAMHGCPSLAGFDHRQTLFLQVRPGEQEPFGPQRSPKAVNLHFEVLVSQMRPSQQSASPLELEQVCVETAQVRHCPVRQPLPWQHWLEVVQLPGFTHDGTIHLLPVQSWPVQQSLAELQNV
jgi:hypothetical protein